MPHFVSPLTSKFPAANTCSRMDKSSYIEDNLAALFKFWSPILFLGGAILFMLFAGLDYVTTPENFRTFLAWRISIAGGLLVVYFITVRNKHRGIRFHKNLIYLGILGASITIESMVLRTGGHASPYYMGMGLIGIWIIAFFPTSFLFSLINAVTVYCVYLAPILISGRITDTRTFIIANTFLVALLSSSLLLRTINFNRLINELSLKFDLEEHRNLLEQLVVDRTERMTETVDNLQKEIVEREHAEQALENASTEWRVIFDAAKDIIMMLDQDFHIMRTNKAAAVFWNSSFAEIIGKPFSGLFRCDEMNYNMDPLSLMMQSRKHEERELYLADHDLWVLASVDPLLDNERKLTGAVVIIKDINDIKRMQDSIRKARDEWEETFNVINDAITIHDDKFSIIQANKAAKDLLRAPFHEVEMRKCYEAYHGVDKPPASCGACRTQQTGESSVTEMFEPHLNRYLETKALPRMDRQGRFLGTVHIVRDITDRKKAEEEQRKLQDELLQVQKMDSIGRLAGAIAHDFNNILSAIIGFSKLALLKVSDNDPVAEDLRIISESGERAAALTRQLLAFSRKQVLEMKVVNLNTVIENMVKMIGRLIGAQVALDLELHTPLGNIVADVGQLEQILMNLLVNARDAMPSGGHITIQTAETGPPKERDKDIADGQFVLLSVTDTGTGMSPEVKERIFEPFFTTKGRGKGTGLGLSTAYGIVQQHNGHIVVRSEPGQGTTFEFYFPLVDREVEKTVEYKQSVLVRGTETVLVVDDEPTILKLVASTLRPLGYNLLEASSGENAMRTGDAYPGSIDLLLTDVVMPGINGAQLADKLRERRPGINVIFMSGYTDDALGRQSDDDSSLVLIQKPLTPLVIAKKVREALDRGNSRRTTMPVDSDHDRMRILYADDDEANRLLVKKYVDSFPCLLDLCENGRVAVDKYQTGEYDIVLMDMQMPVMDGLSACRTIREWERDHQTATTPIIALTGFASSEESRACLDAGCTTCLTKPISREALLSSIGQYTQQIKRSSRKRQDIDVRVDKGLQELVPGYLTNRRTDVNNLRKAAEDNDYETIRILGHTMKGSGGGYGFDAVTEIGGQLEKAAMDHDHEECRKMITKLSEYLDFVRVTYE